MARSVEIARAFITLEANTKGLDQQLSQAEKSLGRVAKFITDHPVAALTGLGTAIVAVGIKVAGMAAEIDQNFKLIGANIPEATERIGDLRDEAKNMSLEFGVSQKEISAGMLALSKTGIDSVDELILANRAAVKASTATGADFGTVVGLLDGALDSFGLSAKDSEAILAKLFVTAQKKLSFEELAAIFESVGKAAIKSGLDWETLTEAAVTLQTQGLKTREIIRVLSKGLDQEGAPALRALAAESHVASDGVAEMAAQAERMNETLPVLQARLREQLNAELIDLGRNVLPLAISGLQTLHALIALLGGGNRRTEQESAFGTLASTGALLQRLPKDSAAAKQALADMKAALRELGTGFSTLTPELEKVIGKLSVEKLRAFESALNGAASTGKLTAAEVKDVAKSLGLINDELAKRGDKPLVPPVDPKTGDGLRKITAGLLDTGNAAKEAKKKMEELEKLAGSAQLQLLSAHQKAREELIRAFHKKMEGMSAADHAKAQGLLKAALNNQLLDWAGFGSQLEEIGAKTARTEIKNIELVILPQKDMNEVIKRQIELRVKHGTALDTEAQKALAAKIKWEAFKEELALGAAQVAEMTDLFGAMAKAIGLSDPELEKVVNGIADVADAIGRVASGDLAGGLIQGISGLSGVISGLFGGESESARQVRQELERTRDKLEQHRRTLGDLIAISQPGAKVNTLAGAIQGILDAAAERKNRGGIAKELAVVFDEDVRKILAPLGLTLEDLAKLAEDLGIDLRPGGGSINLAALQAILDQLSVRDSGFENTFKGQLDKLIQRWDIVGADLGEKLADLIDLIADPTLGSPALAGIKDFDLSTEAGRAGAIDFLTDLFDRGDLSLEDLGGLNLDEFREAIGDLVDFIRGLPEVVTGEIGDTGGLPPPTTGTPPPTGEGPGAEEPVPVEVEPDPVFTPNLEAANWESLLGFQSSIDDTLQLILAAIGPPTAVTPPPLPSGALGGGTLGGPRTGVQIGTLNLQVTGTGNPEADGRAAGHAFMEEIAAIDSALGRQRQVRQLADGSVLR